MMALNWVKQSLLRRVLSQKGLIVMAAVFFLLAGWVVARLWPKLPLSSSFSSSIALYDDQGRLLRLTTARDERFRLWVPLQKISPVLIEATVLHEDRWFRYHPGVNPVALARAGWRTYVAGGRRQGGSTLTMQLARLYWRIDSRSVYGKIIQILRAFQLEALYSKDEIIEAYLNLVPYGRNIEGVGAASLIYFGQRADQLTLPVALMLAVIPQSPSRRGKFDTQPLQEARVRLFDRWLEEHPNMATDERMKQQALMTLPIQFRDPSQLPFDGPHLTEMLLLQRGTQSENQIRTTLSRDLQHIIERQVRSYVDTHRRLGIQNAVAMLVDYRTMEVKALVGSADFHNPHIAGQVNGTQAKRSPGSALKPFVYALAVDQGVLHPLTILKDAPTAFGPFSPENFDGEFLGPIAAKDALNRSRNVPAVAVAAKLHDPTLYQFLKSAGISRMKPEGHYGLALVLGGGEMTMEELVSLYAMLGNFGILKPMRYRRDSLSSKGTRLLSEEASFMTLQMLKGNPRPDLPTVGQTRAPVYWKTGTSWGFRDAWTVGLFGPYALAVWVGHFDGEPNPAFIGIRAAAPLFFRIIDAVRAHDPQLSEPPWRLPGNLSQVEVCTASGDLPNPYCQVRAKTWYIPCKSPIRICDVHRAALVDARTGHLSCPPYDLRYTRKEVYEYWPSDMLRLFSQAGMPRRLPLRAANCPDRALVADEMDSLREPKITTPLRGVTYTLRWSDPERQSIPLSASIDADSAQLYWFANTSFIGGVSRGTTLQWKPPAAGSYLLRAVDERGRSATRELQVEWVQ
ncbi:MAG: penicillin-binding protein 1C [Candidatus Edwardsbacteria bacterium]|nr:penicillin-binding protein 1C [Candidatus Edwardsbacteria bacterium]